MFQPGSRILAQYSNAAGEPLHERVVLAKSFGSFYALCSPDEDVYTECIGGTEDIITYWLIAADVLGRRFRRDDACTVSETSRASTALLVQPRSAKG